MFCTTPQIGESKFIRIILGSGRRRGRQREPHLFPVAGGGGGGGGAHLLGALPDDVAVQRGDRALPAALRRGQGRGCRGQVVAGRRRAAARAQGRRAKLS